MSQDLQKFVGKKVVLKRNLAEPNDKGETLVELEGTILGANAELGILFKPKGHTQGDLIEVKDLEGDIEFAPEKAKKLTQRWLREIEFGGARQHLVSSHGYNVSEIEKMEEGAAFNYHETLDHSDLGHQHGTKPAAATSDTDTEGSGEAA